MTRKKFIKLLMARGVPRNTAVWTAYSVPKMRRSYESALFGLLFADEVFQYLREAFDQVAEVAKTLKSAL